MSDTNFDAEDIQSAIDNHDGVGPSSEEEKMETLPPSDVEDGPKFYEQATDQEETK